MSDVQSIFCILSDERRGDENRRTFMPCHISPLRWPFKLAVLCIGRPGARLTIFAGDDRSLVYTKRGYMRSKTSRRRERSEDKWSVILRITNEAQRRRSRPNSTLRQQTAIALSPGAKHDQSSRVSGHFLFHARDKGSAGIWKGWLHVPCSQSTAR